MVLENSALLLKRETYAHYGQMISARKPAKCIVLALGMQNYGKVISRWALIFVVEARQKAEGRRQKARGFDALNIC